MSHELSIEALRENPFFAPGSGPPTQGAITELVNRGISLVNIAGPEQFGRLPGHDHALLHRRAGGKKIELLSVALPDEIERGIDVQYVQSLRSRRWSPLPTLVHTLRTHYKIRSSAQPREQPMPRQDLYVHKKSPFLRKRVPKAISFQEEVSDEGVDKFLQLVSDALSNHTRKRRFRRKNMWQIME